MKPSPHDTRPEIEEIMLRGYRAMSPKEKLHCVDELTKGVQQMALARIRKQHGALSEKEQQLRFASLWLDRQTMINVFGWDQEEKGY
jgi:hypothetical protein